jgi:hypothetical protein
MLFKKKSVLLVPIVIFIGITVFAICYTYSGNSNYSVYEKFIKAETIHFNFKDRTLPLFLDDSTCSLADMAAFENQGYLKAQNPDSLFLKIKKVFPSIQLETVNDFYAKNENNSNINSEKLSLLIKVRNFFIISNSHNYTLEICFSNVGFNNDKTQAIIYVHSSYYEVTDNTMYIYNRKFGCWIKSVEINVSTILWGSEFMQNDKVPPPPPFEDSVLAPKN